MAKSVFLSYSSKYVERAYEIAGVLQKEGFTVLFDKFFLQPGRLWRPQTLESVGKCEIFIFLISPEALKSVNCVEEYNEAVSLGKQFVVCKIFSVKDYPEQIGKHEIVDFTGGDIYKGDPYQRLLRTLYQEDDEIYKLVSPSDLMPLERQPTAYERALIFVEELIPIVKMKTSIHSIDWEMENYFIRLFTLLGVIRDDTVLTVQIQHIANYLDEKNYNEALRVCDEASLRVQTLMGKA